MLFNLTQLVRSAQHLMRSLELISRSPRVTEFEKTHWYHVLSRTPQNETVLALLRHDLSAIHADADMIASHTEILGPEIHVAITKIQQNDVLRRLGEGKSDPIVNSEMLAAARVHPEPPEDTTNYYPIEGTLYVVSHEVYDLLGAVEMINDVVKKRQTWVTADDYRRIQTDGVDYDWDETLDPDYPYADESRNLVDEASSVD